MEVEHVDLGQRQFGSKISIYRTKDSWHRSSGDYRTLPQAETEEGTLQDIAENPDC